VDPALALEIIREFVTFAASTRLAGSGGLDVARDLLEQVFDESEAADMFEQLESSIAEAPFNFMRKMDPSQIISFIKDEHPQIIAVVLAYLPADLASNVLASMQEEVQGTVAERIGMMGRVNPDAVRLVESILQRKMSNVLVATESSYIGGIDPLISIIQRTDRQTEKILMEAIEERDPKLAETIRANLFLFEDIAKIDDRSLQVVLREVSPQDLSMSLKGVSEDVHEKVLGNLSRRAAQMLEEELELMGRVRRSSVEEAQGKIIAVIRRLEDKGDIEIDVGGVDDFVA
jgi:flagellar motor switch protein FliG